MLFIESHTIPKNFTTCTYIIVESVILANFRLTDRVFYPNMIGKILVNLVQNRVMVSLLGSYDFVAWVKI